MSTTKDDIKLWIKEGQDKGATHMIVVCDTYDWDDYPVYVMPGQDARAEFNNRNGSNMQKVMEVYNLTKDIDKQLDQHRAMEF